MADTIEKINALMQELSNLAAEEMIKAIPETDTGMLQTALKLELEGNMSDDITVKLITELKNELIKRNVLVTN